MVVATFNYQWNCAWTVRLVPMAVIAWLKAEVVNVAYQVTWFSGDENFQNFKLSNYSEIVYWI